MKEYTDREKQHYRALAAIVVKSHPRELAQLNANAKMAIKVMRESLPEANDDTIMTVMGSICFLMARIMQLPMAEAFETVEGIFDNYSLAIASMLGVYDLDAVPNKKETADMEKLFDDVMRRAHQPQSPSPTDDYLAPGRPSPYL